MVIVSLDLDFGLLLAISLSIDSDIESKIFPSTSSVLGRGKSLIGLVVVAALDLFLSLLCRTMTLVGSTVLASIVVVVVEELEIVGNFIKPRVIPGSDWALDARLFLLYCCKDNLVFFATTGSAGAADSFTAPEEEATALLPFSKAADSFTAPVEEGKALLPLSFEGVALKSMSLVEL